MLESTGQRAALCLVFLCLVSEAAHFYTDNGLQQTIIVDRIPRSQRRQLKHEVLQLLGLHHRPRPSHHRRHNSAPSFMLGLYQLIEDGADVQWGRGSLRSPLVAMNLTLRGSEENIDRADLIMSFVNHARTQPSYDVNRRFFFDFSEVPASEAVMEAELRLYKRPVRGLGDRGPFNLHLYRIKQADDWEEMYMELECNMTVGGGDSGWLLLNTTQAAQQWAYYSSTNYGLFLTVTDTHGYELSAADIGIADDSAPDSQHAFLVAFFRAPQRLTPTTHSGRRHSSGRSKRDVSPASRAYGYKYSRISCQRHNLYVSFRDLGWQEWIIAPESYHAFYCHGECGFPLHATMNATNHAIVQTLVHLMNNLMAPKACCVPIRLTAISVLYFDDNSNVILKKFKNMVARACGCL